MARQDRGRRCEETLLELAQPQLRVAQVEVLGVQLARSLLVELAQSLVVEPQELVRQQELVERQRLVERRTWPHDGEVALVLERPQQRQSVRIESQEERLALLTVPKGGPGGG